MNEKQQIEVVYTVDVQGMGAVPFCDMLKSSVFSVRESNKGNPVRVSVLYANIPADLMNEIYGMATEGFSVRFAKIQQNDLAYMQTLTKHQPSSQVRTWNGIVYARIWTALALPDIDRCIYLDNDTLVRKSLLPLWETDLGGKMLGMNMGTVPEYGYNSGVMLMDLAKMRSDPEMWQRLSAFLNKEAKTFFCPDQTAINRFFADEICPVDRIWNYPPMPGMTDLEGMSNAAIWHFYEGGKPRRLDSDDFGRACLLWNQFLNAASKKG